MGLVRIPSAFDEQLPISLAGIENALPVEFEALDPQGRPAVAGSEVKTLESRDDHVPVTATGIEKTTSAFGPSDPVEQVLDLGCRGVEGRALVDVLDVIGRRMCLRAARRHRSPFSFRMVIMRLAPSPACPSHWATSSSGFQDACATSSS